MITVGQLKSKLIPKLHGTTLAKITNPNTSMFEASTALLGRIDPFDTVQRYRIDNAIYDRIYNYTSPSDMKGTTKIVDLRPIGPRSIFDDTGESFGLDFDLRKMINTMTVEVIGGVKTLRVSKCIGNMILLADLDNITNPVVTPSGDVQNLTVDSLDYVSGMGSISFGLSGATGVGTLSLNLGAQVDLSSLLNLGSLFEWLKFPDSSRFTSITLKWGTDASNYYYQTTTTPQGRPSVDSNAWDLMRHDWRLASTTGSPNASAIQYLEININYTTGTALTFCKLDSVMASLGKAYELIYYSQYIYKNASTGALQETPLHDSDIIQLDPLATNILLYEYLGIVAAEIKGKNMRADLDLVKYTLEGDGRIDVANRKGLYKDYTAQFPSQAITPTTQTHIFDDIDGRGGYDEYEDERGYPLAY